MKRTMKIAERCFRDREHEDYTKKGFRTKDLNPQESMPRGKKKVRVPWTGHSRRRGTA